MSVVDGPEDLNRIASRLALILSGIRAAAVVHDEEAVRTGASELLSEIEPLREPGTPDFSWYGHLPGSGAGVWLAESSGKSILEHLSSPTPDWDGVGAAASFAESGIQSFQDAINGRTISQEELDDAITWTIADIEERLEVKDLIPGSRESLTEQLRVLKERYQK